MNLSAHITHTIAKDRAYRELAASIPVPAGYPLTICGGNECVHNLTACPRAAECQPEAASAVSEFQEGSTRPGSHRPLSSWAQWLWKLVTR